MAFWSNRSLLRKLLNFVVEFSHQGLTIRNHFCFDRIGTLLIKIDISSITALHTHTHELLILVVRSGYQIADFRLVNLTAIGSLHVDHHMMGGFHIFHGWRIFHFFHLLTNINKMISKLVTVDVCIVDVITTVSGMIHTAHFMLPHFVATHFMVTFLTVVMGCKRHDMQYQ